MEQDQSRVQHGSPSLEDCLKLLRGERDEQRLAGLLLVTKFCDKDDHPTIRRVYEAVGSRFLTRLLQTSMRGESQDDNSDVYLQLSVTIFAAFCRVPDIAASEDMAAKVPYVLEIMSRESRLSILNECYEFLFLVMTAREDGIFMLYESRIMNVLASNMPTLPDGSNTMELAMRILQLIISKVPAESIYTQHPSELSVLLPELSKQFAVLQNALKFDALHLLTSFLSTKCFSEVHGRAILASMDNDAWSTDIRIGVVAVLQNRVAPAEKLQALALAECVMSVLGEQWLIGDMNSPDAQERFPPDRCLLLVLESSRVEIAVLLNEIAYLKYEASSANGEDILVKQRNLVIAFSLVEKVIKLISTFAEDEEWNKKSVISESTFTKIIYGLDETIGVVLDYLKDSKEHGQAKGSDLLASVRIIGSYLAEAPSACRENVAELLSYMLSVKGEDEERPFYSICFLLPMLCQMTMTPSGCKVLAFSGAYRVVIECLIGLIGSNEDNSSIFLACDTILNLLLKREQIGFHASDDNFIKLLVALSRWTEYTDDSSIIMVASSICALVLDTTSEDALVNHPEFEKSSLARLSQLIKKSLVIRGQDIMSEEAKAGTDLHQIVTTGYANWVDRFPSIQGAI